MKRIYGILVALVVLGSFAYLGAMEEKVAIPFDELTSGMEVYIGNKGSEKFLSKVSGKMKFMHDGMKFFIRLLFKPFVPIRLRCAPLRANESKIRSW